MPIRMTSFTCHCTSATRAVVNLLASPAAAAASAIKACSPAKRDVIRSAGVHCGGHLSQHGCRQCSESLLGLTLAVCIAAHAYRSSLSTLQHGVGRPATKCLGFTDLRFVSAGASCICCDTALLCWVSCLPPSHCTQYNRLQLHSPHSHLSGGKCGSAANCSCAMCRQGNVRCYPVYITTPQP